MFNYIRNWLYKLALFSALDFPSEASTARDAELPTAGMHPAAPQAKPCLLLILECFEYSFERLRSTGLPCTPEYGF